MDPSKNAALQEVFRSLPSEDAEKLSQLLPEYLGEFVSESLEKVLPAYFQDFQHSSGITEEVGTLAFRLAREYRMQPSEVLLKALGLFKLAMDARSEDKRIAILDRDDEIVQEVVGFEPSALQPSHS